VWEASEPTFITRHCQLSDKNLSADCCANRGDCQYPRQLTPAGFFKETGMKRHGRCNLLAAEFSSVHETVPEQFKIIVAGPNTVSSLVLPQG